MNATHYLRAPRHDRILHFVLTDGDFRTGDSAAESIVERLPGKDPLFLVVPLEHFVQTRRDQRGLAYLEVDVRLLYVLRNLPHYQAVIVHGRPANLVAWLKEIATMSSRRRAVYLVDTGTKYSLPKGYRGFRTREQVLEALQSYELDWEDMKLEARADGPADIAAEKTTASGELTDGERDLIFAHTEAETRGEGAGDDPET